MGNRLSSYFIFFTALTLVLGACPKGSAQEKEKPKLKDFGSSLKRIRRDEQKNPAVVVKPKSGKASDEIDVVKVETSLVMNDVLVLDAYGKFVPGLTEKDFVITEDDTPQSVGMFLPGDELKVPRSIVLIIDYSMGEWPYIKNSVAAAKLLVDKLAPSDSMAIVTDDVELIQDFTKNKQKLKHTLDSLPGRTGRPEILTPFNIRWPSRGKAISALLATLNEAFNTADQRPIVIFQTPGNEIGYLRDSPLPVNPDAPMGGGFSKLVVALARKQIIADRLDFSLDDLCRAAEKARATIYTVVPGYQMLGRSTDEQVANYREFLLDNMRLFKWRPDPRYPGLITYGQLKQRAEEVATLQGALATISTTTGGSIQFLEEPKDADRIYSSILSDINRRYLVGYYPTNKEHDGKRRKIEVTVRDHPDYKVVGRKWYYAPAADQ